MTEPDRLRSEAEIAEIDNAIRFGGGVIGIRRAGVELLSHARAQAAEIEQLGKDKLAAEIGYSVYRNRAEAAEAALAPLRLVAEAAHNALICLSLHGFEPGEDPRISDLAHALAALPPEARHG